MSKTAKLFKNGASQAVRLPAEFRFEGDEVYIQRDPLSGNVVLSAQPLEDWAHFFDLRRSLPPVDDFMAKRPANEALTPRELL